MGLQPRRRWGALGSHVLISRSEITNQDPALPGDVDLLPCLYLYVVISISCYLCVYVSAAYVIPDTVFLIVSLSCLRLSMCVCGVECV